MSPNELQMTAYYFIALLIAIIFVGDALLRRRRENKWRRARRDR